MTESATEFAFGELEQVMLQEWVAMHHPPSIVRGIAAVSNFPYPPYPIGSTVPEKKLCDGVVTCPYAWVQHHTGDKLPYTCNAPSDRLAKCEEQKRNSPLWTGQIQMNDGEDWEEMSARSECIHCAGNPTCEIPGLSFSGCEHFVQKMKQLELGLEDEV